VLSGKKVSVYSAHLRLLASTCNFSEFLNRSLRDQFVCGIRHPATRKKLLSEDRACQQALELAIVDEITAKESIQVRPQLTQSVNSLSQNSSMSSSSSVDSVSKNSAVSPSSGVNSRVSPLRQGIRQNSPLPPQSNSYACFYEEMLVMCDPSANLGMLHVASLTQEDILLVLAGIIE